MNKPAPSPATTLATNPAKAPSHVFCGASCRFSGATSPPPSDDERGRSRAEHHQTEGDARRGSRSAGPRGSAGRAHRGRRRAGGAERRRQVGRDTSSPRPASCSTMRVRSSARTRIAGDRSGRTRGHRVPDHMKPARRPHRGSKVDRCPRSPSSRRRSTYAATRTTPRNTRRRGVPARSEARATTGEDDADDGVGARARRRHLSGFTHLMPRRSWAARDSNPGHPG